MPENLEAIGQDSLLFGANDAIRAATVTARDALATGSEGYLDPIGPVFHRSGMKLDIEHAALVVIDPQSDFLSPQSGFIRNGTERRTIENLARLLKASKRAGQFSLHRQRALGDRRNHPEAGLGQTHFAAAIEGEMGDQGGRRAIPI